MIYFKIRLRMTVAYKRSRIWSYFLHLSDYPQSLAYPFSLFPFFVSLGSHYQWRFAYIIMSGQLYIYCLNVIACKLSTCRINFSPRWQVDVNNLSEIRTVVHIIVIHQTTSRDDVFIKIHILSVMEKSRSWR